MSDTYREMLYDEYKLKLKYLAKLQNEIFTSKEFVECQLILNRIKEIKLELMGVDKK